MTTPLELAEAIERLEAYSADDIGTKLHRKGVLQDNPTVMLIDVQHRDLIVAALSIPAQPASDEVAALYDTRNPNVIRQQRGW